MGKVKDGKKGYLSNLTALIKHHWRRIAGTKQREVFGFLSAHHQVQDYQKSRGNLKKFFSLSELGNLARH